MRGLRALEARIKDARPNQLGALVASVRHNIDRDPWRRLHRRRKDHRPLPATSPDFPTSTISPASTAPHPSTPPAATRTGTDSADAATDNSTPPSTSSRSTKSATPAPARITTEESRPGQDTQGGPPGTQTAALRHGLPTPHPRPQSLNFGCCLTQRRYEVTPPGRPRAVMLPAGSTDRSKEQLSRQSCGGSDPASNTRIILTVVRDARSGRPSCGARPNGRLPSGHQR